MRSLQPVQDSPRERVPDDALAAVWIMRIATGDRTAFERLYRAYERRLFGFLTRLVGPDSAEDVFSDVMVEVWNKANRFRATGKASAWLFSIAHHRGIDALRRARRAPALIPELELGTAAEPGPGPESLAVEQAEVAALGAALAKLSPEHRAVVELTFIHGFSLSEVAQIVNAPLGTVKTRVFHARKRLRSILEASGYRRETL
ncbi:MAG TPA: sigma-70 family RNA polymerase sigma factor [Candidatus Baltobacteraceae bacterium]|nr:sigma-70 family RNA polymerase sigma factor [Candidatus Baltobacteraceae bacterium]